MDIHVYMYTTLTFFGKQVIKQIHQNLTNSDRIFISDKEEKYIILFLEAGSSRGIEIV